STYKIGDKIKFYPFTKKGVSAKIATIKTVKNTKNHRDVKIAYAEINGKKVGRILPAKKDGGSK
ncbi:hypothetical protein HDV00_004094, partial [Rhizophlyctis rosea]